MAKQKGNVVTHGLSGKIGDLLVFRQRDGQTIVSKVPSASKTESELQKAHRRRFQRAVLYSSAVAADPEQSAAYSAKAKRGQTIRNVAVADFFHAPDIETIDLSAYHGQPGDVIRIIVTDDFAVKEVKVVIFNPDGTLVEEGYAQPELTGYEWTYTATTTNDSLDGDRIEIFASDTPGNISQKAEEL
ncbi:MAG: hypothetical protein LBN71_11005 [Tannerella sp.]|jgi:hypothetical protein|nr:hypothetical protein [Tannerella sp.]